MKIVRYFRNCLRIPSPKVILLFEASLWLLMARLALWLMPFSWIGRYLGKLLPPSPHGESSSREEILLAKRVGWAVNTVADHLPVELVCLPRALAAWQMLHWRGVASRLHFGAVRQPAAGVERLQTHAWLSTAGVEITGYPVAHGCAELGYFARLSDVRSANASTETSAPQ